MYELNQKGFKLRAILEVTELPESTYHYHLAKKDEVNKDEELEELIQEIFEEHDGRYGYRRIRDVLHAKGYKVNHKRVKRLMDKLGLQCTKFTRRTRSYSSYKGEVGKIAQNKINRRFMTSIPLQKLVTDVSEFKCLDDEKLYLSPIMDLYNSEIISFKVSNRPTLDIAIDPLKEALSVVEKHAQYRTTIHSDQGWHYQHNSWIKTLEKHGVYQSMSRKGNCIDNSPMENFFGILKQEMYYGEERVSYSTLKKRIENYIDYYNNKRIKTKLSGLSPVAYRKQDTQLAA